MKKGKCDVQFARAHGGYVPPWSLKISDAASGLVLTELDLSDSEFARLLSGGAVSGVSAEFYAVGENVGKRALYKSWVSDAAYEAEPRAAIESDAPSHAPEGYAFSHGSWTNEWRYRATFVKYVDPEEATA